MSLRFNVVCEQEGVPVIASVPTFFGSKPLLLDEENDGVSRIEIAAWIFFDALSANEREKMVQGTDAFLRLRTEVDGVGCPC